MAYQRSDYRDKWRVENFAAEARARVGLDQVQVLNPALLIADIGAELFLLSDLAEDELALRRARRIKFDGASSLHPDSGTPMILLNCGRPPRRQTATLMEEIAHLLLNHTPTRIAPDPQLGILRRTYNRAQEEEAYDLGTALLLPKERIQRDVKELRLLCAEIAAAHACSEQLVAYRIRRMRLWQRYTAYASAAS